METRVCMPPLHAQCIAHACVHCSLHTAPLQLRARSRGVEGQAIDGRGAWGFAHLPRLHELRQVAHTRTMGPPPLEAGGTAPGASHPEEQGQHPSSLVPVNQHASSSYSGEKHGVQQQQQQRGEVPPAADVGGAGQQPGVGTMDKENAYVGTTQTGPLLHTVFLDALECSSSFYSPHCELEMARALGLQAHIQGLAGSVALPCAAEAAVEGVRGAIKRHVGLAWAMEAVRQGVGCAKAGSYDEAVRYYNRAIELHPSCVDAYVARGAASANQGALMEVGRG